MLGTLVAMNGQIYLNVEARIAAASGYFWSQRDFLFLSGTPMTARVVALDSMTPVVLS